FNITYEEAIPSSSINSNASFSIVPKEFNQFELDFWGKYGISLDILSKYNVISVMQFSATSKKGKNYTINSKSGKPIFAYNFEKWAKLYKPFDDKKYKFQHLGDKENNFI